MDRIIIKTEENAGGKSGSVETASTNGDITYSGQLLCFLYVCSFAVLLIFPEKASFQQ